MAVDGVVLRRVCGARSEMGDNLVAEEVKVDPSLGAAAFGTAEGAAIEAARGVQVVDRESDVERGEHHLTILTCGVEAEAEIVCGPMTVGVGEDGLQQIDGARHGKHGVAQRGDKAAMLRVGGGVPGLANAHKQG